MSDIPHCLTYMYMYMYTSAWHEYTVVNQGSTKAKSHKHVCNSSCGWF